MATAAHNLKRWRRRGQLLFFVAARNQAIASWRHMAKNGIIKHGGILSVAWRDIMAYQSGSARRPKARSAAGVAARREHQAAAAWHGSMAAKL